MYFHITLFYRVYDAKGFVINEVRRQDDAFKAMQDGGAVSRVFSFRLRFGKLSYNSEIVWNMMLN